MNKFIIIHRAINEEFSVREAIPVSEILSIRDGSMVLLHDELVEMEETIEDILSQIGE